MKTIGNLRCRESASLCFTLLLLFASSSHLSAFNANIKTVLTGVDSTLTDRLFLDGFTKAPVGTLLWFVADTDGNGLPGGTTPSAVLGPGDVLILQDVVDGTLLGNQAGRYQTIAQGIPDAYRNSAIFVLLWNGQSPGSTSEILPTGSYGFAQAIVTPPPELGNAKWDIATSVLASQVSFGGTDHSPPSIVCPPSVAGVECTSPAGAVVTYPAPMVSDDTDPNPVVVSVPASGSTFPIGTTTVTCTATDVSGNSSSCTFTVTVVDTVGPVVACPGDMTVAATGPGGAVVTYPAAMVSDVGDPEPVVVSVPASGSTFPVGSTTVTYTATDASGNSSSCTFTVTVSEAVGPFLAIPPDLDVACGQSTDPIHTGAAIATGFCDDPTVSFSDETELGDLDDDCDVDRDDVSVLLIRRNTPATGPGDPYDLDGDGMITVLDARKLVLLSRNTTTITRTWVAEDSCGNTRVGVQFITRRGPSADAPTSPHVINEESPRLLASTHPGETPFSLSIQGSPYAECVIVAAKDARRWVQLGTAVLDENGKYVFSDTNSAKVPYRWYCVYVPQLLTQP